MPDFPVTIRPAASADIDSLTLLLQILFSIEKDFVFNEDLQRQGLKLMLDNKRACLMVAEVKERVVGMCSGQIMISTAEGGPSLLVEDVIVQQEFRRQGIGMRLMKEIAKWAGKKGVTRLQLLADRNNLPALEFYKRIGWQTTRLICLQKFSAKP